MSTRPLHERVYRALLLLLPAGLRHEFGASMIEDFRDQRHGAAAQGPGRVRALWVHTVTGLVALASREHIAAIRRDVTHAIRLFRQRPAFTLTVILTLAAGIGVTTATFSIVQAVVLQQIPGPESARLVRVFEVSPAPDLRQRPVSSANFVDWKPQVKSLDGVALFYGASAMVRVGAAPPEELQGLAVSDDFLRVSGLTPRLGRLFTPNDFAAWHAAYAAGESSAPPRVVILGERVWQRMFGGRTDIVGSIIELDEEPVEVIGVLADHPLLSVFTTGVGSGTDYWQPGGAWAGVTRRLRLHHAVGRLAPGVTLAQAQAEFDFLATRMASAHPKDNTGWTMRVLHLRDAVAAGVTTQLWLLLGASLGVALIAVLNVSRLMGTLYDGRRHELLTRLALGASRVHLLRQAITESLLLTAVGGACGVVLAWLLLPALVSLAPGDIPRLNEVTIHPQTLGFALGLTLLVGVACGLASRSAAPRRLVSRGQFSRQRLAWAPTVLLAAQVAIALVLAVGTAILVRSMQHVAAEPLGFSPENLVATTVALPRAVTSTRGFVDDHREVQRMVDRLETHPGVVAAAAGPRPLGTGPGNVVHVKGRPGDGVGMQIADVTSHYFLVTGGTVTAGRGFVDTDATESHAPAILNAQAIQALNLAPAPIGQELLIDTMPVVVVGVVANIRQALEVAPGPIVYLPAAQSRRTWSGQILIRTAQPAEAILPDLRALIAELDPRAALYRIQTMEQRLRQLTAPRRFILQLVATFSVLAIALAVIGLAGVVAESVSQRVREIGIRMALGARAGSIVALVVRQSIRVVGVGAIAGVVIAYQLRSSLDGFVYGVTTTDRWSYLSAAAALVIVSLIACYLPARRAAAIDPVIALRRD